MNKRFGKVLIGAILAAIPSGIYAKQWTLKECINYALENNISLQKTQIKKQVQMRIICSLRLLCCPLYLLRLVRM